MRIICLSLLAFTAWLPAHATSLAGPLTPASHGQFQCFGPDNAKRTCQSLASFAVDSQGRIQNTVHVLISQKPPVVMTTITPVIIRGQEVCGPVRPQDIDAATFTQDYKPATAQMAATFQAVIKASMALAFGKVVCTTYIPYGDTLATKVTIDGQPQPGPVQKLIWVSPIAGYTVSP
jgi:hypothetical protein